VNPADGRKRAIADPKRPLEVLEARNAVQIAQWAGADKYASDTYQRAARLLDEAENYQIRDHPEKKPAAMIAREAVQTAEDARLITLKRIEDERQAKERQDAADREATAKAQADAEAQRRQLAEQTAAIATQQRADAEAARNAAKADAERIQAEATRQRLEAEAARNAAKAETERLQQQAALERSNLEAARQAAQAEAERARLAADEANRMRAQSEQEKAALKEQLRQQLNLILETRSTVRGLIVNMSDVLFDTGKYTLRPGAREKLARVSGILASHPSLKIEVEGHTDSVGGEEYNQRLSENRAAAARDYLVQNGINMNNVTARGFGKTHPVATNDTASGRQQNRRVELVVSGEEIGTTSPTSLNITVRP